MGISTIGGAAASSNAAELLDVSVANAPVTLGKTRSAGVYKFTAYAKTAGTPTGTLRLLDSSGAVSVSGTLQDYDTGSSANYTELILRATQPISSIAVETSATCFILIEKIEEPVAAAPLSILAYNSTQTVTVANAGKYILLGGGGGGAQGGGGSGYLQTGSVTPGSYSLVIGAGGATGSNGSPSTFNGVTANGGIRSISGAGGAGGSGGGALNGGTGGANGGNGADGGGPNTPGIGSGVQLPWWKTGASAVGGNTSGGFYGGGGGNLNGSTPAAAAANTGGGGGAVNGTGGSGVLLIAVGI